MAHSSPFTSHVVNVGGRNQGSTRSRVRSHFKMGRSLRQQAGGPPAWLADSWPLLGLGAPDGCGVCLPPVPVLPPRRGSCLWAPMAPHAVRPSLQEQHGLPCYWGARGLEGSSTPAVGSTAYLTDLAAPWSTCLDVAPFPPAPQGSRLLPQPPLGKEGSETAPPTQGG